jgi:transcriptional regulator with XRE-family HTH domain
VPVTPAELAARREALGWSRQALADRSGVRMETIWRIEEGRHGERGPNPATVGALDAALAREERKRRRRAGAGGGSEGGT